MKVTSPYSHRIPTDLAANLRWRSDVHCRALEDVTFVETMKDICSYDPLFFINGFGWTHDTRREPFSKLPFILYPFQHEAMLELIWAFNDHDLLVEKSRDMGASWLCIASVLWAWMYAKGRSFLFVSRVEDYVDKVANPKAMFWKFDFLLDNLPQWLKPVGYDRSCRTSMHAYNPESDCVIDGESTNKHVGAGDRRYAIIMDEFAKVEQGASVLAATRDVTKCRIFNSTPEGTGNAFYDMRQTGIKKLRLHWSKHPLKAIGLYATESGVLKVLDSDGYPVDYEPILDGKLRSPWYDGECKRASSDREIAQELDIDYLGSGCQYFNTELIQDAIRKFARPPILTGNLEYDDTTADVIRWREDSNGSLELWCLLGKDDKPPADRKFVIGADISAGTGASNSCLSIYDMVSNEKVGQYVNSRMRPEQLAKQTVALAKWFNNAFLIWESNGPGRQFGSRVMELSYSNFYMRKNDESVSGKVSDIPGWASVKETKAVLMGNYRDAIEKGHCINRSKEALEECLEYIFDTDGSIIHSRSINKTDPSGARDNHGDRCIADALAWKGMHERARRPVVEKPVIPVGSLAWRNQKREDAKHDKDRDGWGW